MVVPTSAFVLYCSYRDGKMGVVNNGWIGALFFFAFFCSFGNKVSFVILYPDGLSTAVGL